MFYSPAATVGEKAYELDSSLSFFNMVGHFDTEGNEVGRSGSETFSKLDGELKFRYGVSTQFEIYGGARMRQNISQTDLADTSNANLESFVAGMRFSMLPETNRDLRYTMEFSYRQTTYTNPVYDPGSAPATELVLGDSGAEMTFGLHLAYDHTINNYLYAFMGYRRPPNELSPELVYRLETFYPYTNWGFGLGVKGIYSLSGDTYSGDTANKPDQATGATYLFNSINRSLVAPYFSLQRAFTSWKLSFELSQRAHGISTDEGFEYLFGLTYYKPGITPEKKKIDKFKEYMVEASVVKTSPRENFVKIDKGIAQDVEKGLKVDIFKADYFGGNILVATGVVFETGADWAIVKIMTKYREMRILPGFVARGY